MKSWQCLAILLLLTVGASADDSDSEESIDDLTKEFEQEYAELEAELKEDTGNAEEMDDDFKPPEQVQTEISQHEDFPEKKPMTPQEPVKIAEVASAKAPASQQPAAVASKEKGEIKQEITMDADKAADSGPDNIAIVGCVSALGVFIPVVVLGAFFFVDRRKGRSTQTLYQPLPGSKSQADSQKEPSLANASFVDRAVRFAKKAFRRSRNEKIAFLVVLWLGLVLFTLMSIFLPYVEGRSGSIFHKDTQMQCQLDVPPGMFWNERCLQIQKQTNNYYSGIIMLGSVSALLLGISGVLRSNVFDMVASLIGFMLSACRIIVVCVATIKNTREEHLGTEEAERSQIVLGVVCAYMIAVVVTAVLVIRSFGWDLYLKVGSHQHLRTGFQNFLLLWTLLEVDLIFIIFLTVAGLFWLFEGWEMAMAITAVIADSAWKILTFYSARQEKKWWFPIPFFVFGSLVPAYLLYKIPQVTINANKGNPDKKDYSLYPRGSLIITAVFNLLSRGLIFLYGYRTWKGFGIGLRERLDEIGIIWGGEDGYHRRLKYHKDKQGGVNVGRTKAIATKVLAVLTGTTSGTVQDSKLVASKPWSQKTDTERLREMQEVFDLIDKDKAGSVTVSKLFECVQNLGFHCTWGDVEKIFTELDSEGTGQADFATFFKVMSFKCTESEVKKQSAASVSAFNAKSEVQKEKELLALFRKFDNDGSGSLDARELQAAFKTVGVSLPMAEINKLIQSVDADETGEIEFPEFRDLINAKLGSGATKMEAMLLVSAGGEAGEPDAGLMKELQVLDERRLALQKQGFPEVDTMKLAKLYKELASRAETERTRKMADWWARDLVDRLIKLKKSRKAASLD